VTQSAAEGVKNSRSHQLSRALFANERDLDGFEGKAFRFGEYRLQGQDSAVAQAIENFEKAYNTLVSVDRRTAVFTSAFLLSCLVSPFTYVWLSWSLSTIGVGGGFLSLGDRNAHFNNYFDARENLKKALKWMVGEVAEEDVALAAQEENVLKATELLLPVMKEREVGKLAAPGTLDALIHDDVEAAILRNVRARLTKKTPPVDEDTKSWKEKYFKKEQSTMHFMLYGDGRGSPLDFAKGIWFFIYNLFASAVNWVKGEEQVKPSNIAQDEVPNLSPLGH
jgi:hypothetical protein